MDFDNNKNSSSSRPPSIDKVALLCGAHGNKFFTSQAHLFEYIKEQNQKILEAHLRSHQSLVSTSHRSMMMQNRLGDASSIIMTNNNGSFSSSSSSMFGGNSSNHNNKQGPTSTATMMMMHRNSRNSGGNSNNRNHHNEKPIEDKLLRPFQFHVDPSSSAPSQQALQQQQGKYFVHRSYGQQNNSSSGTSNTMSGGSSSSEKGLLALFNEAGRTQRENLSHFTNPSSSAGSRRQREDQTDDQTQQQQHPQQQRFFLAITREIFARFAPGGDDNNTEFPQAHQHFFEIIEDQAPCVLYFDVEMEPHTALTQEQQNQMLNEVHAVEKMCLINQDQNTQQHQLKLKNELPTPLRRKLHCCPAGCNIKFDESKTRDVLVRELRNFINEEFPLPLDDGKSTATIDENSFIVLVSPSPKKFSQHYIIRFKEDDARFANNNVDMKLVVTCFVDYLYEKAFHDPEIHSALFYHETTENRTAVVSLNSEFIKDKLSSGVNKQQHRSSLLFSNSTGDEKSSALFSEDSSYAISPAQKRAIKLREEKQQQQNQTMMSNQNIEDTAEANNNNASTVAMDYTIPAISLKCVIDEAVYSKNRMMRCYGSSKVGKLAVLEFDHHWHQGGRLNHFLNGDRMGSMISTLISEPVITVQDERLKAANLFRLVDIDALHRAVLARGGRAAQTLQSIAATTTTLSGSSHQRLAMSSTTSFFSSSSMQANYETKSYKGHENAAQHFPLLCKEITTNQNIMEKNPNRFANGNALRQFFLNNSNLSSNNRNNNNSGNVQIESLDVSVPKKEEQEAKAEQQQNQSMRFTYARITAKIRNSRFCHVVKRQHRSNGVYWIIKCSFPLTIPENQSSSNNNNNLHTSAMLLIGSAWMEQRCFDDDCKGKHNFTADVPSEVVAEIRAVLGIPDVTYSSSANDGEEQSKRSYLTLPSSSSQKQTSERKEEDTVSASSSSSSQMMMMSQSIQPTNSDAQPPKAFPTKTATTSSPASPSQLHQKSVLKSTAHLQQSHLSFRTKLPVQQREAPPNNGSSTSKAFFKSVPSRATTTSPNIKRPPTTSAHPKIKMMPSTSNDAYTSQQLSSAVIPCSIHAQKGSMSLVKSGAIPLSRTAQMAIEEQKRMNMQQQPNQQQQQIETKVIVPPGNMMMTGPQQQQPQQQRPQMKVRMFADELKRKQQLEEERKKNS